MLGRPFGAPNAPEFQTRVLKASLQLLECQDGPPVLKDFPEEAPDDKKNNGVAWGCPVSFASGREDESERLSLVINEIQQLKPWHEIYVKSKGKVAPSVTGLDLNTIVELLECLACGEQNPEIHCDLELREVIRLGCDDLRTWYCEAAQGQPGKGTSEQINHWFWQDTAVAGLIADAAGKLLNHPDAMICILAERAMVPRSYKKRNDNKN